MSDPLRRLKALPWREMLLTSFVANVGLIVIELFLSWSFTQSSVGYRILKLLYGSPISVLIPVLAAIGIGAFSVYFFEMRQEQYLLNQASLWALVLCLLGGLFVKSLLPLTPLILLASLSQTTLISVLIGVFWKGRPYWR